MKPDYCRNGITLFCGDCFDILPMVEERSVDACITDPPYNTTKLEFDEEIDLKKLWSVLNVVKQTAPVVMFSAQPFTTDLIISNRAWFRYEIVWCKTMGVGFFDANKRPLRAHENVLIFCERWRGRDNEKFSVYNPQFWQGEAYKRLRWNDKRGNRAAHYSSTTDPWKPTVNEDGKRYPLDWQVFSNGNHDSQHPTQKPIDFTKWLVETYSNPGDLILDCFMGSGTTGVACTQTGRRFIGIEKKPEYFEIAVKRVEEALLQPSLFATPVQPNKRLQPNCYQSDFQTLLAGDDTL